jgi:predicted alpha/beta hydrolase family esterase
MQDPYSAVEQEQLENIDFERIPLPWFVKRRVMKILLRDVHHYLFNTEHEPRPGERFKVKDEIQRRFVETITQDAEQNANNGPHVIVSHSMGTVISYDCLKHRSDCPPVTSLMTIGSPLGLDEIQDMMPDWSRENGYPVSHVVRDWTNVYDRLDPVAGFDPNLANDYRKNSQSVINDIKVSNSGRWRHSSWKYFQQESLRNALQEQLDL